MGEEAIRPGLEGFYEVTVADEHVPDHLKGTNAEVVSTPDMVWFMEIAAFRALQIHLPEDQTSVGTVVSLKHLAGTPKGMRIEVRARLVERDRRRCIFEAELFDEVEKVAEGRHERFIVPLRRDNEKLAQKFEMVRART